MKKEQKLRLTFQNIQSLYPQVLQAVERSRARNLWHQESILRNQIRRLQTLPPQLFPEWQEVFDRYTALLDTVSQKLLEQYNQKNHTGYSFEEVIAGRRESYWKSGIISVLMTAHIPRLVSEEFSRRLPDRPQEEYPDARTLRRRFFLHLGDTNTGKTYQAVQRLKSAETGIYLAPLRILALENFERFNREGVPCSLLTGEEEISVPGARHLCCTVEKARLDSNYEVAVLDEVQLLADSQRGDAWTRVILGLTCPEIHLCGAALAREQLLTMIRDCGDSVEEKDYHRLVPLQIQRTPAKLSAPEPGDAFVAFSKRKVLTLSRLFREHGVSNSVIYGDLPPEVRKAQYEQFISGQNPVLVATDAIGMGVNLPVRRIVFTDVEKFDGENRRPLTSQEVKQIAGRAGRIGIFDVGYLSALERDELDFLADRLQAEDQPLRQAIVGPSEAILKISMLPLQEKLALWSTRPERLPYYRKKDVRDELLILDLLKPYHLPEQVEWKLMRLPFNPENETLLAQFDAYVQECFTARQPQLSRPVPAGGTCADYEIYYQQISLYYSFSKTMDLPFDAQWVTSARAQTSRTVQRFLEG